VTTENLTNTVSAYSTFVNIGNPDAVHANHLIQMIIGETLTTPTAAGCTPIENNVDQIVSTIPVPGPGNPGPGNPGPGNPGPGNPGPGNPGPGNPGPGNPGPGNNTFALAPSSAPQATSLAAASFRATAIARLGGAVFVPIAADLADDGTNVATPPPDQKQITIRYWHCTAALGCQLPDGTIIPGENVTPGGPSDPVNDGTVGNPNQTSGTVVAQANNTNIVNDFYSVNENSGPNNLASVLANDTPGHGGTLSAVVFGNGAGFGPFHGTVVMNPDGSFVYTPAALFYGTDSFNYLATETAGTASSPSSALAKVTITVNHVNQPPVANPDVAVVGDGSGPAAISVLANDTDPEGDQLTVTAVTQPSLAHGGSASSTGTGVTYTPSPNYAGPDSFTYTVCDNGTSTLIGPDPKCAIGTVNVTVVDNIPPVIAAHADVNAAATNASGAVVNYARPATSDNVDPAGLAVCAPAPNSQFPLGNTNVTCNATDAAGNPAVATNFVVHVVDTTPPVVTVPAPLILEATGPGGAVGTFNATATDNVDGSDPVTCVPPSGSTFPLGTTNVSCTAKDNAGNTSAPAGFGVTVRDTTRPTLFLPGNIATVATSVSGAIVNFNASATDLVDVSDPVICAPASGSMFTVGTTVVNCSATDAHANRATGSFSVTVTLTFGFVNVQNLPPGAGKTFHPGSAVPLAWAWTLNGVTVDTPDATSRPSIRITGPNGYNTTFPDDPGSSGFQYNTSFVHQYNWQTKNLPVGTYNVFVTSRENGQTSGPFVVILQ
jgi:hypothetical protein